MTKQPTTSGGRTVLEPLARFQGNQPGRGGRWAGEVTQEQKAFEEGARY